MADEPVTIPTEAPAPAVEAPSPIETPSVPVVPAVEAPAVETPVEVKSEEVKTEPSVLSAATEPLEAPKPDAKVTETPEVKTEAAPLAPLSYTDLKFPDGVKLPDDEVKSYTDIFGKHQIPQSVVQELVDHHTKLLQENAKRQATVQREVWNSTRQGWVQQFIKDPDIGGNRRETTIQNAGAVIERYGGNADQVKELRDVFSLTGAGDHPAVIRLLAKVGEVLKEGRMVPATRARATPTKSSPKSRYTNNSGN